MLDFIIEMLGFIVEIFGEFFAGALFEMFSDIFSGLFPMGDRGAETLSVVPRLQSGAGVLLAKGGR